MISSLVAVAALSSPLAHAASANNAENEKEIQKLVWLVSDTDNLIANFQGKAKCLCTAT
jgi:hypothetical protein